MEPGQSFYSAFIDDEVNKKQGGMKYTIQIKTGGQSSESWYIERNLKEIHEFRLKLRRKYPNIPSNLPFIKILGGLSVIEKDNNRAQVLNFIQEIIRRTDVMTSEEGKEFFELNEKLQAKPFEVKEVFKGLDWPIINYNYQPEQNLMLYVQTDLNEASQVAKQATNQKWPCFKTEDNILKKPVSKISIANISSQTTEPLDFLPQEGVEAYFTVSYSRPVTAFTFDHNQRILLVGLSSGLVVGYSVKQQEESDWKTTECSWQKVQNKVEYEQLYSFNCGSTQIVHLEIDANRKQCIAVSKNQGLFIFDLESGRSIIYEQKIDEESISCAEYDALSSQLYVASNSGVLNILDISQSQPVVIMTFSIQVEKEIKAMQLDKLSGCLIATTGDSKVHVFEKIQGNTSPFKIITFEGRTKGSQIALNRQNKEIYVGDTTGNITVWGYDKKIPKYAWTAHKKAIVKMTFYPEKNVLVTASKDKVFKLHVLGSSWIPAPWNDFLESISKSVNQSQSQRT